MDLFMATQCLGTVYFANRDALKGTLVSTLKEALPTVFFGVPRVWEKVQEKMIQVWIKNERSRKNIKLASSGWEGEHWVQEGFWKLGKEDRAGVQQGEAGRAQWGQALLQDCRQDGFQQGSCHDNFLASRFFR